MSKSTTTAVGSYRREPLSLRWLQPASAIAALLAGLLTAGPVAGETAGAEEATPTPQEPPASVTLKDGSRLVGEIVDMAGDSLKVKTNSAGAVPVKISEVVEMYSKLEMRLLLKGEEKEVVEGSVESFDGETFNVRVKNAVEVRPVPLSAVAAINPPVKPAVIWKGNVGLNGSIADGNTKTKTIGGGAELIARLHERHRFTVGGAYNYADDSGRKTAQNYFVRGKYDFFVSDRFYLFATSRLEGDVFAELNLRTASGGGLGYQLFEKGDLEGEYLKGLETSVEAGASYVTEDYYGMENDRKYAALRWALRVDWEIVEKKVFLFHAHEGFPSLEDSKDFYITTAQGVRLTVIDGFFASFEVQWSYVNRPASGRKRSDTLYLFGLGYAFDTSS